MATPSQDRLREDELVSTVIMHSKSKTKTSELCNVTVPLFDEGDLIFEKAFVSFVGPISKHSRYAKQAVLHVELHGRLKV